MIAPFPMHFAVLALDYDGTIATDGSVADSTARALRVMAKRVVRIELIVRREWMEPLHSPTEKSAACCSQISGRCLSPVPSNI